MKRTLFLTIGVVLVFVCNMLAADTFRFQGRLTDQQGRPIVGDDVRISFSLYDQASGGTLLVSFPEQSVSTNDAGLFATDIGNAALTALVKSEPNLYLQITVRDPSGPKALSPRQKLGTVPASLYSEYALTAGTADSVADNSVTSQKIKDGEVSGADLAPGSVGGPHLVPGSVGSGALSAESVQSRHLSAGSVQAVHLSSMLALGSLQISSAAIQNYHIADQSVEAQHMAPNSVGSAQILAKAILSEHLSAASVSSETISANSVTSSHIQDAAVVSKNIAPNVITSIHLTTGSIEQRNLSNGSVTGEKIAMTAVGEAQLASNAVSTSKIQDNSITKSKLASGAASPTVQHGDVEINLRAKDNGTYTLYGSSEILIKSVDMSKTFFALNGVEGELYNQSIRSTSIYLKNESTLRVQLAMFGNFSAGRSYPYKVFYSVITFP